MSAVTIERPPKAPLQARQKVREGLTTGLRLSGQIFQGLGKPAVMISLALTLVLIASAVGVAMAAHQNRMLYNTLSELHLERDAYQREWSQLLLEQSALSAHSRIEQSAVGQLGMVVPGRQDIVLVPASGIGFAGTDSTQYSR